MRRIGSIVVFFFMMSVVHSQNVDFQQEWSFGANAGVTLSRLNLVPRVSQELLVQEVAGLTARYISQKHFGILVELNYSLRGWKERQDMVLQFNRYSRSLSYIELPVMTHIYFDLGKRVRLVGNLGPQIGWNTGEKVLEKELGIPPDGKPSYPVYYKDDFLVQRKFDYGITGGLGLEVRTGIGSFILDGRYYFGLSDIFNNTRADVFQSSHHQVILIKLTYLARRGK